MVPHFVTDEWIEALDRAAAASSALDAVLADLADGEEIVIEHTITDVPGSAAPVSFHLVLGRGPAAARRGPAAEPSITFTQSYGTARDVASGAASAQAAFMSGALRVGGRVDLLLAHHGALVGVDDVFAELRSDTQW